MGWYGGQEGAARTRWNDQSRAAYNRFRGSVRKTKLTSFFDQVEDNHDREISTMIVRNPMGQDDLVNAVLEAAPTAVSSVDDNGSSGSSSSSGYCLGRKFNQP